MLINIHYDFTDGTELSYKEGCVAEDKGESFNTNCLDFFNNDAPCNVIIKDSFGNLLDRDLLMSNKSPYTVKEMRDAHNLQKMFKSNSFNWKTKFEPTNTFLDTIKSYGWSENLAGKKKFGSVADYYLRHEIVFEDNYPNPVAFMLIDDGVVDLKGATYHIYSTNDLEEKSKIFEGYLESESEFRTIMKVLGFE